MAKTLSSNTFTLCCFNPTRDLYSYIECCFAQNTLSEMTSIPALSYGSPPPPSRATYMSAGLEESPVHSSRTRRFSLGVSNF